VSDLSDPITTLSGRAGEAPGRLIGDVVVEFGFATREVVEEAVGLARAQGKPTGQTLVERGALRHDQLACAVAERYGINYVDLALYDVDMDAVGLLDMDAIRGYQAVPVSILDDGTLLIVTADPMNAVMLDDISMITGRHVKPACASADEIRILIMRLQNAKPAADELLQTTWIKGPHPCWQVQKALDEQGIDYGVVRHPAFPCGRRKAYINLTGQKLLTAIELQDGRIARERRCAAPSASSQAGTAAMPSLWSAVTIFARVKCPAGLSGTVEDLARHEHPAAREGPLKSSAKPNSSRSASRLDAHSGDVDQASPPAVEASTARPPSSSGSTISRPAKWLR